MLKESKNRKIIKHLFYPFSCTFKCYDKIVKRQLFDILHQIILCYLVFVGRLTAKMCHKTPKMCRKTPKCAALRPKCAVKRQKVAAFSDFPNGHEMYRFNDFTVKWLFYDFTAK